MNIYVLSLMFSILFLLVVLEMVRRQKLKEQYSLLWILFGMMLLLCSFDLNLMERAADWMHVKYAPAVLFLFGLLFSFVLILHLTVIVTRLSNRVLRLTQELTILKEGEGPRE